jgi:hypothetical protein
MHALTRVAQWNMHAYWLQPPISAIIHDFVRGLAARGCGKPPCAADSNNTFNI